MYKINFEKINFGASGPALRLFLSKENSKYKISKKVISQIKYEKKWGIKKINKYKLFNKNTNTKISKIRLRIQNLLSSCEIVTRLKSVPERFNDLNVLSHHLQYVTVPARLIRHTIG